MGWGKSMNGGKDVRERNVGNKGKEGFEYSRKREWKIGKGMLENRRVGKRGESKGRRKGKKRGRKGKGGGRKGRRK